MAIYMRIISYLSKAYRVNTLARFSSAGKQHREGLHTRTDVKVISSAYHRVSGYYTRSRIDWVDDRREWQRPVGKKARLSYYVHCYARYRLCSLCTRYVHLYVYRIDFTWIMLATAYLTGLQRCWKAKSRERERENWIKYQCRGEVEWNCRATWQRRPSCFDESMRKNKYRRS